MKTQQTSALKANALDNRKYEELSEKVSDLFASSDKNDYVVLTSFANVLRLLIENSSWINIRIYDKMYTPNCHKNR